MNKRIKEIRDRVEVVEDESKSQTNESLKALTNDISIILKPCIRIADQIASECIQARQDIPYLLEEIEKRDKFLSKLKSKELETIEAIKGSEYGPRVEMSIQPHLELVDEIELILGGPND